MKKSLIAIIILFFCFSGQAQVLRRLTQSAGGQVENSTSKQLNKQVDKGVNKLFDKILKEDSTKKMNEVEPLPDSTGIEKGDKKPKPKGKGGGENENGNGNEETPASLNKFMKKLGASNEAIPHKVLYEFTAQILMLNEATDEKGKAIDPIENIANFNENTSDASFGLCGKQENKTTTIIDMENKCVLVLTDSDGKKSGFATKFDPNDKKSLEISGASKKDADVEECKMAKTGNTKTISGYSCAEYRCETSKFITIAWATKELASNNNKMFGSSAMGASYKTDGLEGMVIQYETHSKTDKSSTTMTIKSIDMKKSSSFSTAGYEISSFSFTGKK